MKPSELIAKPEAWTKNTEARNALGLKTSALDPDAVSWCLAGAIRKTDAEIYFPEEYAAFSKSLCWVEFNDAESTTHQMVLDKLKEFGLQVWVMFQNETRPLQQTTNKQKKGESMPVNKQEILDKAIRLCEEAMTTLSNPGICLACGEDQEGCEPDARNYECESCGEHKVFGAEEVVMMLA